MVRVLFSIPVMVAVTNSAIVAPLLDAFGMQENILDYFVPAYMLFDVKLDIEIK